MIDHIIEQTKQKKIFIATHSQGTTGFFAIASDRPEYQEKLMAVFPMAPAVFMSESKNPLFGILGGYIENINVHFKN